MKLLKPLKRLFSSSEVATPIITHPLLCRNLVILCILQNLYTHYKRAIGAELRIPEISKFPSDYMSSNRRVHYQYWEYRISPLIEKLTLRKDVQSYLEYVVTDLTNLGVIIKDGTGDVCRISLSVPMASVFVILDHDADIIDRRATAEAARNATPPTEIPSIFLNTYGFSFRETDLLKNVLSSEWVLNSSDPYHPIVFERLVEMLTYQLLFDQHTAAFTHSNVDGGNFLSSGELIKLLAKMLKKESLAGGQFNGLTDKDAPPPGQSLFLQNLVCAILTKLHATGKIVVDQAPNQLSDGTQGGDDALDICKLSAGILARLNETREFHPTPSGPAHSLNIRHSVSP